MTVVLPAPAMCSTSDHHDSRAQRHGASVFAEWSSQRRRELAECVAFSLALHAALVLWASVHSPGLVERVPDEVAEIEAPTFTIASLLSRSPLEEPIEVASLAVEPPPAKVETPPAAEEPVPSPIVLDQSKEQVAPVPILVASPPPATEQAAPATPAPP